MTGKRSARVFARETMQRFNYDPLESLILLAQETTNVDVKQRIAETLLPFVYPKLSNMTLEGEVGITQNQESQAALLRRVLEDPELADAAQKLSIAASMACLDNEGTSTLQ